ncbi:Gfo/Idh/MocA family protein [Ruania zhangjianzhongii]|uniref:Gfo/Idh/MocA family protein n=1 Tax=Ruania zhangjianzhongii TaxID=2603206 RepID=UPI0011C96C71|nr:Gfo/Idh/MocA family oxidoreductase [Ruania zhangjianzhongii]
MSDEVGVGILGLGGIGLTHARALRELAPDLRLRAFSGGDAARAQEAGWPEAVQVEPDELADTPGVDVVAICSPSEQHAAHALAALNAGRHVVVEKPLALQVSDAERIVALATETGAVAAVISQRRLEPEYAALQEALAAGSLGQIRLATTQVHWWRDEEYYQAAPWRTAMAGGGGSLMNQGVHNVDLLRWLCGPVTDVTAQYGTLAHAMDAEDTTVATLRFASGALGMISTSTATPPGSPATVTLHTDRGVVELGQGEVLRWDMQGVPAPTAASGISSGAADPRAIGIAGHVQQWGDVLTAIRTGGAPVVSAADGAETVRLLCAVYRAAETGRTVRPEEL